MRTGSFRTAFQERSATAGLVRRRQVEEQMMVLLDVATHTVSTQTAEMLWNHLLCLLAVWLLLGSDCESHLLSSSSLPCLERPCFWLCWFWAQLWASTQLSSVLCTCLILILVLFYGLFLRVNDADVWGFHCLVIQLFGFFFNYLCTFKPKRKTKIMKRLWTFSRPNHCPPHRCLIVIAIML